MLHKCQSILIHCIDFRLTRAIRQWMENEGLLGDCDVVALAGASQELVDGEEGSRKLLLKQIEIAIKLHKVKEVVLMHHTNCGAYAQKYDFQSVDDEISIHKDDLKKAKKLIQSAFPNIIIKKIIAVMKDDEGKKLDFVKL